MTGQRQRASAYIASAMLKDEYASLGFNGVAVDETRDEDYKAYVAAWRRSGPTTCADRERFYR